MPCSRRSTSACAEATSITPAEASAITENATSSAITIPAAWSIVVRTPCRVRKRSPPSPKLAARACVSVWSSSFGLFSQIRARFTRGNWSKSGSSEVGLAYMRGPLASGNATLSGDTATPTTRRLPRPTSIGSPTRMCQRRATPRSTTASPGPRRSWPATIA